MTTTPPRRPAGPVLDAPFVVAALGESLVDHCGPDRTFDRTAVDSRQVEAGDLFVALPGTRVDGHDFAAEAVQRGAAGLLLARRLPELDAPDVAQFYVADTLAALQRLAAAWRRQLPDVRVIGITGSVGKTTTRAFVEELLSSHFRVQASTGSFNNEIGVPVTLLGLRTGTERAVVEMGMYTRGEIAQLCEWALPHTGVVLNVGPVHLERAGSLEAIALAKRELVEALPADGVALLNADDEAVRAMASHTRARVSTFGTAPDADVRGTDIESHGADGFSLTIHAQGGDCRIHVRVPGAHLATNVLAAAAVGLAEGLPLEDVAAALGRLSASPRLCIVPLASGATMLDDTYNANPASVDAALDLLGEMPGRKIALLGDMRELGALSSPSHQRIGRRAAEVVDVLYTVGDLASEMGEAARAAGLERTQHLDSPELALDVLRATLRAGDAVLVKGSRALALERVTAGLQEDAGEARRP